MAIGNQQTLTGSVPEGLGLSDCHIRQIDQRTAEMYFQHWHYSSGVGNAAMPWGMYHNDGYLLGVIAFHTPISENVRASIFGDEYKNKVTELHRMAIHPNAPHNTGSWFISRSLDALKQYKPQYWAVISFADETKGHDGTVYQAANADYYGKTDAATYYEDESGRLRAPRQCGENIGKQEARERGWEVVERKAKHRYVFWLPDPYQSKDELRKKAKIEKQDYPKSST